MVDRRAKDKIKEMKFEDAMRRLELIVKDLEDGNLSLEDALKGFEEGMKLIKFCSDKLEEAEKRVTLLIEESGGKHVQIPFDPGDEDQND